MKTLVKILLLKHWIPRLVILTLVGCLPMGFLHAAPAKEAGKEQVETEPDLSELVIPKSTTTFEYQLEDRSDPFVPFLTEKVPELDPNEIVEPNQRLTGMQLFEPGQLTLVALMKQDGKPIAMVEDFNGKGYLIQEGVKIGRRGIVRAIVPNKVIIEETATTRSGKILTTKIVMVLKKEGEE
jgi:Tfp pilus assembly protein PilP